MKRIIQWSIDHHWIVIGLSVLLFAAGAWTARQMPIDVFPDLTAPTVTILTEGHGMAPEEMESLVTFPIESAINGASGVRRVRSATAVGIAVVWVEFDWGTDIFMARQLVSEKLALVSGVAAAAGRAPGAGAGVVDHGRDPVLCDLVRLRRSADAAHDCGHDGPAAAAGGPGRLAGDADRRRRASVPGRSRIRTRCARTACR